ncbi:MAG: 2-oxo acid dehydrogenase subunit E2, partial [Anaerolineales bacterium]|nr:2-oxo acid dehydrogenase subunit E2 [Anaerolineales bacterium]
LAGKHPGKHVNSFRPRRHNPRHIQHLDRFPIGFRGVVQHHHAEGTAHRQRPRAKKLQPDEVKGRTFTITNHGISGSLFATPIINQPQCAILGVGAIQKRPVVINDAIAIRPMFYLSLTFDHRILDGASADSFLAKVADSLQNWS